MLNIAGTLLSTTCGYGLPNPSTPVLISRLPLRSLKVIHSINTDLISIKPMLNEPSPMHKTIMEFHYSKGYTHLEISASLDIPLGSVKTSIRNANCCHA